MTGKESLKVNVCPVVLEIAENSCPVSVFADS
jgi:hypothetical protein